MADVRIELNNAVEMPMIGFGTSGLQWGDCNFGDSVYEAVRYALKRGYRFFDSAELYLNEKFVGRAINDAINEGLVKREDVFVCTKVWNTHHGRDSVVRACRNSLKRLEMDYIDLYLVHWPAAYKEPVNEESADEELVINPKDENGKLLYSDTHFIETWQGMEETIELDLVRAIGLSNFNHLMIDQLIESQPRVMPSVLQVECHPYLAQKKLADYCSKYDIVLNAYCPLGAPNADWPDAAGKPKVMNDKLVGELAAKYDKTAAQVILRYHIQRLIVPIPKSSTPKRIEENLEVFDFEISHEDMEKLMELDQDVRYCLNTAGEYITDHKFYPFSADF